MSKRVTLVLATLNVTVGAIAPLAFAKHDDDGHGKGKGPRHRPHVIVAFETMYGVDGPFVDPANAIHGIVGERTRGSSTRHVDFSRPTDTW